MLKFNLLLKIGRSLLNSDNSSEITMGFGGRWHYLVIISVVAILGIPINPDFAEATSIPVTVTITKVDDIGDLEGFLRGESDLYAGVVIDGDSFNSFAIHQDGDNHIEPFWVFTNNVDSALGTVAVHISIWEHDDCDTPFCSDAGLFGSGDDHGDLDPQAGDKDIDLTVDLNTGTWSGDTTGSCSTGTGDDQVFACWDISVLSTSGDADGDGLLDGWEVNGFDSDGDGTIDEDLPGYGANPLHKDLFLEFDWMNGQAPQQVEIQAMKNAFASAPLGAGGNANPDGQRGINLWVDTGGLTDPNGVEDGIASCNDGIDNGGDRVADLADPNCLFLGDTEDNVASCNDGIDNGGDGLIDLADPSCLVGDNLGGGNTMTASAISNLNSDFYNAKSNNFNIDDRRWIFRYGISAQPCPGCGGGWGEIGGNDFIEYNHDGGTIMHEFGHNLNLRHGGSENDNCKPNYVGVMNYDNQFGINQNGGGLIIDYSPPRVGNARGNAPLTTLDETNLSEGLILDGTDNSNQFVFVNANGQKVSSPLNQGEDWNGNTVVQPALSGLRVNIDTSGANGRPVACTNGVFDTSMPGFDDWTNISLPFRQFGESADSAINPVTDPEPDFQELLELQEELDTTDLEIDKTDSDPAVAGQELVYTVVVTNNGPNPASAITVTDTLPVGVSYVSGTLGCSEGPTGIITCLPGELLAGESSTISITVLVDADLVYIAGGTVTITNNVAVENVGGIDPDLTNNSQSEDTLVIAVADLEITKFTPSSPSEVLIGDTFDVVLTKNVVNNGPSSPVDVDVDVMASATSGVTVDPASASSALTALAIDDKAEVVETFTGTCVKPGLQKLEFVNTVVPINADDPDLDNNEARVVVEVECLIPVQINIHPGSNPNSVNLKSKMGDIPLAILTTAAGEYGLPLAVDATKIDPLSVHFGPSDVLLGIEPPGGATEVHNKGHILDSFELNEVTKDGDSDMVLHFNAKKTGLVIGDTDACVKGQINIGGILYTFFGCDQIRVIP